MTAVGDDPISVAEIPDAVVQEIASARRLVLNARPEHQIALFKQSAANLWRTARTSATVDPGSAAHVKIVVADALYCIGNATGLDDDDVQHIIATAQDDQAVALNGHSVLDEPPPASPEDYGQAPRPHMLDLGKVPLRIEEWLRRDLPPPDLIMGEWFATTSRIVLNAATGLGKTNFALALAAHIAAGRDFLHWHAHRQARVLFVDGEMSRRLLKRRAQDVCRRCGFEPEGLFLLSHEDVEGFPPLNTAAGKVLIEQAIEKIGGIDAVTFDNVMALVAGDQKEEEGWQRALPLVNALTKRGIGQMWINHTGHDKSRGYGTSTREWRMDTVIHLTEEKRADTDVSFRLEFQKARERTPEIRRDFEAVIVALVDDEWTCSAATAKRGKPSPMELKFLQALRDVFAAGDVIPFQTWKAVKVAAWRAECVRLGLLDPDKSHSARTLFAKYRRELVAHNLVGCDNELAWLR